MRVLRAGEHRRMPWKNGAGETVEVATAPAGASMDDFLWRVSMAKVPASGPFSSFPNVDRTLAVLQGEMILHVENRPDVAMTAMSTPYRFPGDVATSATVIETVTDLNVMTRRGACRAGLARLERCSAFAFEAVGGETLLLLRDGARLANGQSLAPDDVLWLSAGETVAFSSPATLAWAIEFSLSA